MSSMVSNHKNTEKSLILQIDPGAWGLMALLNAEPDPIQVDCHDREVPVVFIFPFRRVSPAPMILVHRFEDSPFRIGYNPAWCSRTIEAFLQRWKECFISKLVVSHVCSLSCVCTPVAHHDSIIAESQLIKPVNDNLCTSRQKVGVVACYHNCFGIKLNIDNDGVSIILFLLELQSYQFPEKSVIVIGTNSSSETIILSIAKCQSSVISSISNVGKFCLSNHASNHDDTLIIHHISAYYKGCFDSANHDSNHESLKIVSFCTRVTTRVTTILEFIICIISITYDCAKERPNHESNHDRLNLAGSKKIATTQVTTMTLVVIIGITINYRRSNLLANHVSNHDGTRKLLSKKTYSSILLYLVINIIILNRGRYVRAPARTRIHAIGDQI